MVVMCRWGCIQWVRICRGRDGEEWGVCGGGGVSDMVGVAGDGASFWGGELWGCDVQW